MAKDPLYENLKGLVKMCKENAEAEKIPESDISVVRTCTEADIDFHFAALDRAVKAYKRSFINIALNLYWIDEVAGHTGIVRDSVSYQNIAEFASDMYGISKATTYQYIAIVKKFGKINPNTGFIDKLDDKYRDYGSTALIVMSGMNDDQLSLCKPDMKVKELKAILNGLPSKDKTGDPKKPEPKKDKPNQNSNSENLYILRNMEDYETYSREILKCIKTVLMQDDGIKYHINISMTWD